MARAATVAHRAGVGVDPAAPLQDLNSVLVMEGTKDHASIYIKDPCCQPPFAILLLVD